MSLAGRPALGAWVVALLSAGRAWAGPPYVTDDPEPTRTGGWENYLYIWGTTTPGTTAGQAGIELNYGAAANVQLTLAVPAAYVASHGLRAGFGDLDFSAKYRFLHAAGDSWLPDAAVFPAVTAPTGAHGFGTGHMSLFVPVWFEKDFGKWSSFGGGGYAVNPGSGQRDYALIGWAITRSVGDRLDLGVEIYHQTPSVNAGVALTNLAFGAIYQMTRHWALMGSGGPGLQRPSRAGASAFYVSLQFTN